MMPSDWFASKVNTIQRVLAAHINHAKTLGEMMKRSADIATVHNVVDLFIYVHIIIDFSNSFWRTHECSDR